MTKNTPFTADGWTTEPLPLEEKDEDLSATIWISAINNEWYLNIQLPEGHNEIKLSFGEFMESVKKTTENILEQQVEDKT